MCMGLAALGAAATVSKQQLGSTYHASLPAQQAHFLALSKHLYIP